MCSQILSRRTPYPGFIAQHGGGGRLLTEAGKSTLGRFPNHILGVLMVVNAIVRLRYKASANSSFFRTMTRVLIVKLLKCLAETTSSVLVHSFEHEQNTPDHEHRAADKGCNATAVQDLAREL